MNQPTDLAAPTGAEHDHDAAPAATAVNDAHTHAFTRPFFTALAREAAPDTPVGATLDALAERVGLELPPDDLTEHRRRWITELDRAGVARAVTFASAPEEIDAVAQFAQLSGGRLIPYAVLNPLVPAAPERVRDLAGKGFRGFLTFPAMHHFDPGDTAFDPVWHACARAGAPVIVHTGMLVIPLRDVLGLPRRQDWRFADPLAVGAAANRNPDTAFIVPHFGAGPFAETLRVGAACPNVYADTSSSNSWAQLAVPKLELAEVFERALAAFGPRRLLFGTDSSVFPRGYRGDLLDAQRAACESLGLSDAERAAIFGGNLTRLLHLDA